MCFPYIVTNSMINLLLNDALSVGVGSYKESEVIGVDKFREAT